MDLVVTDPMDAGRSALFSNRAVNALIDDARDWPFVRLLTATALVVGGGAAYFYLTPHIQWWQPLLYWAVSYGVFLGPFTLFVHNFNHRPLFKAKFAFLHKVVAACWGPLFGQTPNSYYAHHVGMHHAEGNMWNDTSSTLPFQRDSVVDFLRYWGRFALVGTFDLIRYLRQHGRSRLLRNFLIGEAIYYGTLALLLALNWRATLIVYVFPYMMIRFLMMAGNWGQHAFIDPAAPDDSYRNSITCINSTYNRQCFNDGYHIGHHLQMTLHWTELPGDFVKNKARYVEHGALVFRGVDFFVVWVWLMLGRYDWLARRYVDLADAKLSQDQIIALLKARTRRFSRQAEAAMLSAA